MLLLPRSRYNFQPREGTEIDWGDPLSAGLRSFIIPRFESGHELVTNRASQLNTATYSAVQYDESEHGEYIDGASSGNACLFVDSPSEFVSVVPSGVTFFAVTQNDRFGLAPITGGYVAALASSTSNNTLAGIGTSGTATRLRFIWRDTANSTRASVDSSVDVWGSGDTGIKIVAGTWDPALGTVRLASNGVILAQTVNTLVSMTAVAPTSFAAGAAMRSNPISSARIKVYGAGLYDRAMSDQELIDLTINPWRLIAVPRGRSFVPVGFTTSGTQTLLPGLVVNGQTFYSPTVTAGTVSLSPSLVVNNQTFYGPTVSSGAQVLSPSLLTNGQTFYGPTVTAGAVTLSPTLLVNDQTFYSPTVIDMGAGLYPTLVINDQTFYDPAVTAGTVTLSPSLVVNDQVFYDPTVSSGVQVLSPALVVNGQTFYGPTVTSSATVSPSLVVNSQTFYGPTVTPGAITLSPGLVVNEQIFFGPSVIEISEYPLPSDVRFGVIYGPGGIYVGTFIGGTGDGYQSIRSFTERH